MKIFEFDQSVDYGLLEPRRRGEMDTKVRLGPPAGARTVPIRLHPSAARWRRPTSAPGKR